MTDEIIRRLREINPATGESARDALEGDGCADEILASVLASDTGEQPRSTRSGRRPRRIVAGIAVACVLAAGGTVAAINLTSPPDNVRQAANSLTLPSRDMEKLAPRPGSLRQVVDAETKYGRWALWTLTTADGRAMIVDSLRPSSGAPEKGYLGLGTCPPMDKVAAADAGLSICAVATDVPVVDGGIVLAGRVVPAVTQVTATLADGSAASGHVGDGFFILPLPEASLQDPSTLPQQFIASDAADAQIGAPVGGGPDLIKWFGR